MGFWQFMDDSPILIGFVVAVICLTVYSIFERKYERRDKVEW